jgi:hypothetical protein
MSARRSPSAIIDWSDRDAVVRHQLRLLERRIDTLYITLILLLSVLAAVLIVASSVVL